MLKMYCALLVPSDFKDGTPAAERYFGRDQAHNRWVLSELDRLEALAVAGTLEQGPTLAHGDWVYADQLQRIAQARIAAQTIIATETQRGHLTWQWVFDNIFVPQYVRAMETWVFENVRRGEERAKISIEPLLVFADQTNLWLMNDVPHPLPCSVEGMGIDDNRVKMAVGPHVPDMICSPNPPNHAHEVNWLTKTSYDGRQTGRLMIVKVGGGGHAGGRGPWAPWHPDYATHPEFYATGFGTWGAEPWMRYAVLGVPDPTMALVCWPSTHAAAGAHEFIGHSCGVLCHPNDQTGIWPGDWTQIVATVGEKNDYPLEPGEFYIEAQQDEFRNANVDFIEWVTPGPTVTEIRIEPPLPSLRVGGTVQLRCYANYSDGSRSEVAATWASASPNVATVNAEGLVTARKLGRATITATFNGKQASTLVTVAKRKWWF